MTVDRTKGPRTGPIAKLTIIQAELLGAHEQVQACWARVYEQIQIMSKNPAELARFRQLPFWKDAEFPSSILMAGCRFAYDAKETGTNKYKTAAFASKAMEPYFRHDITARMLRDTMKKAGGIGPLKEDRPWPSGEPMPLTWPASKPAKSSTGGKARDPKKTTDSAGAVAGGGNAASMHPTFALRWRKLTFLLDAEDAHLKALKRLPCDEATMICVENIGASDHGTIRLKICDKIWLPHE